MLDTKCLVIRAASYAWTLEDINYPELPRTAIVYTDLFNYNIYYDTSFRILFIRK